ncbi:protein kinase [Streptomyces sp. NPDC014995]|uniref:serine/threonine-protein kinase n=1 Tax=Streptomyces sp. NPDC014995 TaxID=3364936 RepID=UPI0036FD8A0C
MGEVFAGRYELADPIGRGGVGAVWRAWDHRRRRYVAAKVLQQRDAHALLRFVREQALRIDHPHVLAPASWAADDDKVLFTMDLVAGGSLVHLVGDYGPLPPAFVCTLLDQLLSGLAAVHAEGVVHRDIKPANVLLEATGTARPRLRLSDFGIAMRLGEPRLTETNLVVGTPGYLAPEQMLGYDPDFPADLFAVGLVALYLLEGAKPDAKALVQYFAEHGTPAAPKGIPEPLWQVVATLLQPDPQARFRTATGARKALAAAAELLPEPGPDDERIEIFDHIGPLPAGFGPRGPLKPASGVTVTPSPFERTSPQQNTGDSSSAHRPSADRTPAGPGTDSLAAWPGTGSVSSGAGTGAVTYGSDTGSVASGSFPSGPGTPGPAAPGPGTSGPRTPEAGSGSGPDSVPGDPRQSARPAHSPAAPAPTSGTPAPSMSDTGSFHLPPPQSTHTPTPVAAPPQPTHTPVPASASPPPPRHATAVSPYEPTYALRSHEHRADASTASYTAQDPQESQQSQQSQEPQEPPSAQPFSAPAAPRRPQPARRGHRRARAPRRPGPPAKVALPLLLLALVCYAVGFWALSRI